MLSSASVWSQILTSGYGVSGVFIAATIFGPSKFGTFSLLVLLQTALITYLRSSLLHPGIVQQRTDPEHRTSFRAVCIMMLAPTILYLAAVIALLRQVDFIDISLIAAGTVSAVAHDWLRHRAFADDLAVWALYADTVRFVLTPVAAFIAFPHLSAALAFAMSIACSAPSVGVLALKRLWSGGAPNSRAHRDISRWQSLEFGLGQLQASVPLLLFGWTSNSAHVSGFRLAQTWLGPVNLLTTALATTLLLDAIKLTNAQVKAHARELAWRTFAITAVLVVLLSGAGLLASQHLSATSPSTFALALVCVGLSQITGAYATMHLTAMRAVRKAGKVTALRCGAVATTWLGYASGFVAGGPTLSLVCGFLATAFFWAVLSVNRFLRP